MEQNISGNEKSFTKEEIEGAAKKFVDEMFAEMNCHFNKTCIKCNCQL